MSFDSHQPRSFDVVEFSTRRRVTVAMMTLTLVLFGLLSFLALREFITLQHTRRSDHRSLILALSGRIAPRQRRGRKALIGVSAIIAEPSGRIGPWAERL